jgi:hypothetical protein
MKHIYTVKLETHNYAFEFATSRKLTDLEGWKYAIVCQLLPQLRLASDANTQEVITAVENTLHNCLYLWLQLGRNDFDELVITIKELPLAE